MQPTYIYLGFCPVDYPYAFKQGSKCCNENKEIPIGEFGEFAFWQPCHSAALNMHAFLQLIRICLFATSNKTYLFASKNTFLKHLVIVLLFRNASY